MNHIDHKHRKPVPDEIKGERVRTIIVIALIALAFCAAGYIDMHSGVH